MVAGFDLFDACVDADAATLYWDKPDAAAPGTCYAIEVDGAPAGTTTARI